MAWREQDCIRDDAMILTARDRQKWDLKESRGCSFSKAKILQILNQTNCLGIRVYHGRNDFGDYTMVVVGVEGDDTQDPPTLNDMHSGIIAEYGYTTAEIADKSTPRSPLATD